ncbi:PAS domain S-box protein [Caldimonas brevitalea]|uniref:PAS domain-containing hybrid sensor histidine kinase/response regulator n=1 Tax=Caldimonas brevitalea TaxID=413882 RepID=UPI00063FF7AA
MAVGRPAEERLRLLVEGAVDYAIFLLDNDGIVSSWNVGAEKIKGYRADEIIGRPFTVFYPDEANARQWPQEELRRARRDGRFEDEGWRVRKDGTRFWANVVITALRNEQGEVDGFAKITRDLTERRRNEEALRLSEERFRLLVDGVRDHAIYMLDPSGHIQSWNAGAQAIKGYSAADVIGRHVSLFYTAEDRLLGQPEQELAQALKYGRTTDEGWRVRKDGSVFWALVTVSSVYDEEGHLRGFAKVTRDMTERRRLAELEHSARRISQFLAILGHELRNPLAPIRNAVSIMQIAPEFPAKLRGSRDIVDRQLSHLTRLVDDLLDVGRITTGKISLKRQRIGFREVVQRSVEATRPLLAERGHELSVKLPPQAVMVWGDDTRLVQVLQNLLSNAAKYTDPGGRVSVRVDVEDGFVVASVSDNGRGIAPDALQRIFDLFVQEDSDGEGASGDGGLGIGLTLARTLIEMHGGTLRAESEGRGRGSRFTVRLPTALDDQADSPGAAGEQPGTPGRRVLVVDDNRDSADTMAALLVAMGHDARAVHDGKAAVIVAAEFQPQVVLLDLNLPGDSGFNVLHRLRAEPKVAPARIVAMTGYGQESDRIRTAEAGFDAHLTKPVGWEQLQAVLE